jgi:antitoxin CcdA
MRMGHGERDKSHACEWTCGGTLEAQDAAIVKRPTNLSVRGDLVEAARAARLNLSALLERALEEELVRVKWRQWRQENVASIAAYNRHVKAYGAFTQIWMRP